MTLPDAPWQHRTDLGRLLTVLGAGEGDTRYVGGCVRDTLLGLPVSDIDLATRLDPQEVIARLKDAKIKAVPTGLAHGTVTAVIAGQPVEITTLRRDVATDGRRATIAYTNDWREDAARRDFTFNALSADPDSGEVFDYFGGLADVEARRVRFIGDPLTRIAEDHLRILRFFRFHARFGAGAPDEEGLDACTARANDLMALSRERIADEMLKLLALPDPAPTVALMIERNILKPVLPEISDAARLAALCKREQASGVPPHPLRRFAALLPQGETVAADIGARLRLSKAARARLACAEKAPDPRPAPILAFEVGAECAADIILLSPDRDPAEAATLENWQRPRLGIGGGDLIAMGLQAGPVVAQTLQQLERDWAASGFPSDSATVRAMARAAVDQALLARQ